MKNLHILLLSAYLLLAGIISLFTLSIPIVNILHALLAIGAGVYIIINSKSGVFNFLNSILLGVFLLLNGLIILFGSIFEGSGFVVGVFAIVVGLLVILENKSKKVKDFLGGFLLAVWLLLTGLVIVIGLSFLYLPQIMGLCALVAGIFIYFSGK